MRRWDVPWGGGYRDAWCHYLDDEYIPTLARNKFYKAYHPWDDRFRPFKLGILVRGRKEDEK